MTMPMDLRESSTLNDFQYFLRLTRHRNLPEVVTIRRLESNVARRTAAESMVK